MKKIFLLIFLFYGFSCFSQNYAIEFAYDNAGNRYSRTIVDLSVPSGNKSAEDSTATTPYNTMMSEVQVSIYPNPTKGQLNIELSNLSDETTGSIVVTDLQGRVLMSVGQISSSMELDFTPYAAGKYNMTLIIDGQRKFFGIIRE